MKQNNLNIKKNSELLECKQGLDSKISLKDFHYRKSEVIR